MRKLAEKVAIIAQICITMVFAITTLLDLTMELPDGDSVYNNGVLKTLIFVLFIVYIGLSVYILYVNFSERENIKRVLLFCDSESATTTTTKVVKNIINKCARQTQGITVKKIKIRSDDKKGLALTLKINVDADNVSQTIDTLRCLIADSFKNTLGLTFNTVNFEVNKLQTHYIPNIPEAEEKAEQLSEQREITTEIYNEPLDNEVDLSCVKSDEENDSDSAK